MSDLSRTSKNKNEENYGFSEKWSPEISAYGFTQVPNILLTCQGSLGLKQVELVTLLQLMSFWFKHGGEVYPSILRLAKRSDKGYSTTQRNLKSLEDKGFIKRKQVVNSSNRYNLKPCVNKLYKHQKTCTACLEMSQKRGLPVVKMRTTLPLKTTKQEDSPKRLRKKTNGEFSKASSMADLIAQHRYGGVR
ncbi:MAG: helix-turn-helix domain-containing protein [Candidatus Saccharibacteria bacterium]|nr:helix-turn-helix domain-containing protein [Candidatus Saccharibacteria bacterium]